MTIPAPTPSPQPKEKHGPSGRSADTLPHEFRRLQKSYASRPAENGHGKNYSAYYYTCFQNGSYYFGLLFGKFVQRGSKVSSHAFVAMQKKKESGVNVFLHVFKVQ